VSLWSAAQMFPGPRLALAMGFPVDHFLIMVLYALLVSSFFAMLWASDRPSRTRLFTKIFGALVLGGLAVAWLMYPFPS
jgi:hypothetical protein